MPKRNRELKNRVREIRSHGSVRGVGRKPHLYSEASQKSEYRSQNEDARDELERSSAAHHTF